LPTDLPQLAPARAPPQPDIFSTTTDPSHRWPLPSPSNASAGASPSCAATAVLDGHPVSDHTQQLA
jgi:hypothetical protein